MNYLVIDTNFHFTGRLPKLLEASTMCWDCPVNGVLCVSLCLSLNARILKPHSRESVQLFNNSFQFLLPINPIGLRPRPGY